jgi:hypothetical protein
MSVTKGATGNAAPTSVAENQLHSPSIATVVVSGAVGRLQNALHSATTALTGDIEAILPVHCSIGMKTFCADFMRNISRQEPPILISKLVTEQVKGLQKACDSEVTIRTSPSYFKNYFIAGMLFVLVLATVAVLQMLESIIRFPHVLPRTAMYLTFGVICSGLFLIATGISWILQSTLQSISFVACFCAFLLIIFGAIQKKLIPNFLWIKSKLNSMQKSELAKIQDGH